jgi:hypothetical protein
VDPTPATPRRGAGRATDTCTPEARTGGRFPKIFWPGRGLVEESEKYGGWRNGTGGGSVVAEDEES